MPNGANNLMAKGIEFASCVQAPLPFKLFWTGWVSPPSSFVLRPSTLGFCLLSVGFFLLPQFKCPAQKWMWSWTSNGFGFKSNPGFRVIFTFTSVTMSIVAHDPGYNDGFLKLCTGVSQISQYVSRSFRINQVVCLRLKFLSAMGVGTNSLKDNLQNICFLVSDAHNL